MRFCFILLLCFISSAQAELIFKFPKVAGKSILYVMDKGILVKGGGGIVEGDAANIRRKLRYKKYDEVWLYSGGGNLLEGVKIGLVLREYGAFVRVKKNDYCVSACTVAFLGGLFRTIDKGAQYKVHAYSSLLRGFNSTSQELKITGDTVNYLNDLAASQYMVDAPSWGALLFEYFRLMIQPIPEAKSIYLINSASVRQLSYQLKSVVADGLAEYRIKQLNDDVSRIKKEGIAAAHDIAMRLEGDAIKLVVEKLTLFDEQGKLKYRAKYAIRMLKTMFESHILSTFELNLQTLKEYGYTNVASENI